VSKTQNARLLTGPSHPLCLAAVGMLLLNDHVLKAAYHNVWTGKISDVCWLIVAPIVLAAVLHRCRVHTRAAQWLAMSTVGLFFVVLQLWAPLGDTLVGWYGGLHIADPTDLLALPALLLAPLCWRRRRRRVPMALGIGLIACVASSTARLPEERFPCDGEQNWDPSVPLLLQFHIGADAPVRTPAFQNNIRVYTADGKEVELLMANIGGGAVAICPNGGLEPSTEYFWTAGPFDTDSMNTATVESFSLSGVRSFVTDDRADNAPITTALACSGVDRDVYSLLECDLGDDTGDTGP